MTLAAKQQQLIDDLGIIDDMQERLAAVVDRARTRAPLGETERTDAHRVRGCVSQAWLVGTVQDGRWTFRGDADSPLVRGLICQLCELYSGATAEEIAAVEPVWLEELGFTRLLSPTRLNGLRSVRARIRELVAGTRPAAGSE